VGENGMQAIFDPDVRLVLPQVQHDGPGSVLASTVISKKISEGAMSRSGTAVHSRRAALPQHYIYIFDL
jgi:hypothetical protein